MPVPSIAAWRRVASSLVRRGPLTAMLWRRVTFRSSGSERGFSRSRIRCAWTEQRDPAARDSRPPDQPPTRHLPPLLACKTQSFFVDFLIAGPVPSLLRRQPDQVASIADRADDDDGFSRRLQHGTTTFLHDPTPQDSEQGFEGSTCKRQGVSPTAGSRGIARWGIEK